MDVIKNQNKSIVDIDDRQLNEYIYLAKCIQSNVYGDDKTRDLVPDPILVGVLCIGDQLLQSQSELAFKLEEFIEFLKNRLP
jgi:hypothetical protein